MQGIDSVEAGSPASPVESMVEAIRSHLERVSHQLDTLGGRIEPVLKPMKESPDQAQPELKEVASPLVQELARLAHHTEEIADRIISYIDRCQL